MASTPETTPAAIDRLIRQHLALLGKPGALTVRPGRQIRAGRLTGKPAIVVSVHTKTDDLPRGARLPRRIGGVAVDVRQATALQRLRARNPAAAAIAERFSRPEARGCHWPYERELPGGQRLDSPASRTQRELRAHAARHPALTAALAATGTIPQIPYVAPPGQSLAPIELTATVTAHVSPDAGFTTLSGFLAATRASLVIGMYDFTSGPILALFEQDLAGGKSLQMVLDNPTPDASRNQTDDQTVSELGAALGGRARIARALTQGDVHAAAWMFPAAYHIKVIVRDGSAVWLSSGNLDNSNQPDPASPPAYEDRDWHVVIEDAGLAGLFQAFLDQDFASASVHQQPASAVVSEAAWDAAAQLAAEQVIVPSGRPRGATTTFPAQTFSNVALTITPLFTPDTLAGDARQGQYIATMVKLIDSAQKRLYVQLQYIEASTDAQYTLLLQAIAGRVAAGLDVRLIESLEYGMSWAEKMKTVGVDLTANIALQPNVHNKGFVIDSSIVVISSQNFSPEGVRLNRDAGVIIANAAIAQYFETIFLHDWTTQAKPFAPPAKAAARAGSKGHASRRAPARTRPSSALPGARPRGPRR